jgi:hypothetical protein
LSKQLTDKDRAYTGMIISSNLRLNYRIVVLKRSFFNSCTVFLTYEVKRFFKIMMHGIPEIDIITPAIN